MSTSLISPDQEAGTVSPMCHAHPERAQGWGGRAGVGRPGAWRTGQGGDRRGPCSRLHLLLGQEPVDMGPWQLRCVWL